MNHAVLVGVRHGIGNLFAIANHGLRRQSAFGNLLRERSPVHKFHHDVALAVGFAHVVNRANVGMIQRRRGTRFAQQHRTRIRVVIQFFREEFQRYVAVQAVVVSAIHHAHSALANFFDDSVMRDALVAHKWGPLKSAS